MQQLSEDLVRYDLDDLDVCWLEEVNFSRREMGKGQQCYYSPFTMIDYFSICLFACLNYNGGDSLN